MVLDLSSGIAGAFCTKLLAGAGATVVKIEDPAGDALRRRAASRDLTNRGDDAPLFKFLNQSKLSIVIDSSSDADMKRLMALAERADVIVWSPGSGVAAHGEAAPSRLFHRNPAAIVCTITPFGLEGPWARRAASDLTLQAWAGGIGYRGEPGTAPVRAGGEISEWATATFAAVGLLAARHRAIQTGIGDLLDVSMLESVALSCALTFPVTSRAVAGRPLTSGRLVSIPGIHRCQDAWVGFMVLTGQQWLDFCVLVEQPEWLGDPTLLLLDNRVARRREIVGAIDAWAGRHTMAEIMGLAAALRVPAAPVGDGAHIPGLEQVADQGFYEREPDGSFLQPVPHFRFEPARARGPAAPAPALGRDSDRQTQTQQARPAPGAGPVAASRPLCGLRVADFTAFWAGPVVGRFLAMMGADVIKIESPRRPDGFRNYSAKALDEDQWWEWAPMMHGCNVGKRGLGLDLSTPTGREVLLRLVKECDVLIENYTPRVMESWGLGHERLMAANPDLIVVRMPAFGLAGPWRDRPGYAQTVEQISGLAWITGHRDGPPQLPNGQCDPVGGNLALVALLLALQQRRITGRGLLVECPLLLGALNLAAEQVVEYTSTDVVIGRSGNRAFPALQGVYRCSDRDTQRWVAISVTTEAQCSGLRHVLGDPPWLANPGGPLPVSDDDHDQFDAGLTAWCSLRSSDEILAALVSADVPVAKVLMPHEQDQIEQLVARRFFEDVLHPVTGANPHATLPMRCTSIEGPWHLRPAPLLGEHNTDILHGLLGLDSDEIADLERRGIIGTRVVGTSS